MGNDENTPYGLLTPPKKVKRLTEIIRKMVTNLKPFLSILEGYDLTLEAFEREIVRHNLSEIYEVGKNTRRDKLAKKIKTEENKETAKTYLGSKTTDLYDIGLIGDLDGDQTELRDFLSICRLLAETGSTLKDVVRALGKKGIKTSKAKILRFMKDEGAWAEEEYRVAIRRGLEVREEIMLEEKEGLRFQWYGQLSTKMETRLTTSISNKVDKVPIVVTDADGNESIEFTSKESTTRKTIPIEPDTGTMRMVGELIGELDTDKNKININVGNQIIVEEVKDEEELKALKERELRELELMKKMNKERVYPEAMFMETDNDEEFKK